MKYCKRILEKKESYQIKRERLAQKNTNKTSRRNWKGYKEFSMIPNEDLENATFVEVAQQLEKVDFIMDDIDYETDYEYNFRNYADAWQWATVWGRYYHL
jgi:hypothetical protein